ncbi:hypothetical protein BT93_B1443 [Corymbia citriodora subsp. variegata]|nr:hypothetical protein BT93_B1443 [Corymbia citriodora subsp. variegata]
MAGVPTVVQRVCLHSFPSSFFLQKYVFCNEFSLRFAALYSFPVGFLDIVAVNNEWLGMVGDGVAR